MNGAAALLSVQKPAALDAILRGGTLCGVLNIAAAFSVYGYFGLKPVRLLQGIATAVLGLCLHFFIAFTATTIYVLLSRWVSWLIQHAYVSGALFAVAVYYFMQYIVIPLSAATRRPFSFKMTFIGVVIHIFCVGLPISLTARRYLHT